MNKVILQDPTTTTSGLVKLGLELMDLAYKYGLISDDSWMWFSRSSVELARVRNESQMWRII